MGRTYCIQYCTRTVADLMGERREQLFSTLVLCVPDMYNSFFAKKTHKIYHVFRKVSWCSGYHISLTPKRSRVRSPLRSDKSPVSTPAALRLLFPC